MKQKAARVQEIQKVAEQQILTPSTYRSGRHSEQNRIHLAESAAQFQFALANEGSSGDECTEREGAGRQAPALLVKREVRAANAQQLEPQGSNGGPKGVQYAEPAAAREHQQTTLGPSLAKRKQSQPVTQSGTSSTLAKRNLQFQVEIQEADGSDSNSDDTQKTKWAGLHQNQSFQLKKAGDRAILPQQIQQIQSQIQINRNVADFACSDLNESNTGRSQLAVGREVDHTDPFGMRRLMRASRSPSGQQQYDSDGMHVQSSQKDAVMNGSVAATTEVTRQQFLGYDIKDMSDREIRKQDLQASAYRTAGQGGHRTGLRSQADHKVLNNKMMSSQAELRMGGRGSLQEQRVEEPSLMCATELTLGHLDSSSRQDTQVRDEPAATGGRESRGSIKTVHIEAEGTHATSIQELRQPNEVVGSRALHAKTNEAHGFLTQAQRDQNNSASQETHASKGVTPQGTAAAEAQQSPRRSRNEQHGRSGGNPKHQDVGIRAPNQLLGPKTQQVEQKQQLGTELYGLDEASLQQLSQAALQSSQGKMNETDLVSDAEASQNDYMADQSSRQSRGDERSSQAASERTLGYEQASPQNSEVKSQFILMVDGADESPGSEHRAMENSSRTFLHELICKQGAVNTGEVDGSTLEVATAARITSPRKDIHLTSLTLDQQDAGRIDQPQSQAKSQAKQGPDHYGEAASSNKSRQTAQCRINSAKINKMALELHVKIQQSQEHETLVAFEETPIKIKEKQKKNIKFMGSAQGLQEAMSEARRCLSRVMDNVGEHIEAEMARGVKMKPELLSSAAQAAQQASILADASSMELIPQSQAAGAAAEDHEEDTGRQKFEESRVEVRNWRGVGIEQINEKGSLEECSKDQSHRPSSQVHPAPLAGSQGQASIQNSVHDIQEGSKDESRYVTQDGRNSTRLSQFGDLGDSKEAELTVALYPDLANGSVQQDRSPISHQNKATHPAQLNNIYNSSRKVVGQVSSLSRPALHTTVSPILSIEANIGRTLALKRAVQQDTIGPNAKNPIAADVRMFEDGAWQLPGSDRHPVQRSVVIENTAGLPLRAMNAEEARNQSPEGEGSLPAKASERNRSQKHLPLQTSDLQQKQPSAEVSPKPPHSPRKLVQQLDEYYHKRNQLNASNPNDSDIFKVSKASKISKIQSAHQYSTIPQHALGASSIRPFVDTPISPVLPLQEVAEEAQEFSKKSLQKLGKLKRPAVPKGLKIPSKSRYARKQPESGFEPEKPIFVDAAADPEFMYKYSAPKQSDEQEDEARENEKEVLRVGGDFNLREFLYQNKLEGLLGHDGSPSRGSGIHSFHKQQQQRGSLRNRLPAGTTPQMLKGFDYMSRIRDKNIAKALSHTHLPLNSSTETGRRGNVANGKQAAGQMAAADLLNADNANCSRHPASINRALEAGVIDIDKAYLLIQFIQKAHGEPTLTDAKIHTILRGASQGRLPRDKSNSRIQEFKWLEVMKFMQSNPHVLVQLLTLTEPDVPKPAHAEQFFNRRPRYTDKILQRMHQGLPGIISSLQHGSGANLPHGMPTSTHQGLAQQGILPPQMLPGRNLQTLSNAHQQYEQPSFEHIASLPRPLDREPAKAPKQSGIEQREQRHRNQTRVGKSSFSPVLTKITKGAANLDESRSTKAPVLMPVRERASYAASQIEPKSTIMPVPRGKTQQAQWPQSKPSQRLPDETYLAESQEHSSQEPGRPLMLGHPQFHSEGPPQVGGAQRPDRRHQGNSSQPRDLKSHQQQLNQDQTQKNRSKYQKNYAHPNDEQISIQIDRVRPMFEDQFPNTQSHIEMIHRHQDALAASGDDGVTPHNPAIKEKVAADMKMMVQHMDLRKPKTNENRRRQQTQSFANPDSVLDPNLQAQLQATSPGPVQEYKSNFYNVKSANYSQSPTEQRNWPGQGPDRRSQLDMQRQPHAVSHMVDQRTELTSRGSVVLSRFEELANQKRVLEAEEAELSRQRLAIVEERDKVTRQLKRLERKEELIQREDQVKKQRLILEIEKKRLREDIAELDSLKMMLEGKKKDTQTGFGELAESNKELRSLKSGELHRERSMMLSKQSTRSRRIAGSRVAPGSNSHTITDERDRADDLDSRDQNGKEGLKQPTATAKESQARNQRPEQPEYGIFDPSRANATPDGIGAYDSQPERSHSRTVLRTPANPDDEPTKPVAAVEHHTPVKGSRDAYQPEEDEQRLISSQRQSRKSVLEAYRPPEALKEDVKKTIQKTPSNSQVSKEQARMLSSPKSNSNLTFLSGAGVFDWAQSRLMEDVLNKRDKFDGNEDIYNESEVLDLIEEVKLNQKMLRGPDKMKSIYQKAFETLQELMLQMNQHILFQMIAKKYNEVNLDNTVKLLVRCKQLLASRQLVFKTLEGIIEFEKQSKQIRRDVDAFLESEPADPLISAITKQAHSTLPDHAQAVIDDIAALRDHHKLFSKMGATTSKGNQVLNVMAYKRRDAMRYLLREYEAVRRLVQVVDISMPLIVKK